jgi:hypothetical protein
MAKIGGVRYRNVDRGGNLDPRGIFQQRLNLGAIEFLGKQKRLSCGVLLLKSPGVLRLRRASFGF